MKTDFMAAAMYDATFAWAHAANKTLEEGIYPGPNDMRKFGKAVVRHLNHLDFEGKLLTQQSFYTRHTQHYGMHCACSLINMHAVQIKLTLCSGLLACTLALEAVKNFHKMPFLSVLW